LKIATTINVLMTTFLALVAVQILGADIGNLTAMSLSTAMADCEIPEWAAKVRFSVRADLKKDVLYHTLYLNVNHVLSCEITNEDLYGAGIHVCHFQSEASLAKHWL
jgi:hypothetical protein